jgi:hypothetical protein
MLGLLHKGWYGRIVVGGKRVRIKEKFVSYFKALFQHNFKNFHNSVR